jgi:hypothetical protein
MVVQSVENVKLFKGVVVKNAHSASISIRVGKQQRRDRGFVIPVELHGKSESGKPVIHARAEVEIADRHESSERRIGEPSLYPMSHDRDEIYRRLLFHGPDLQAITEFEGHDDGAIAARVSTSPSPASWMERPLRQTWLTDPLAIDAAFQLLVVWTGVRLGAGSLPTAVGAYYQYRRSFPAEGVRVLATARRVNDHRVTADIEFLDLDGRLIARIEGYECVVDSSLHQAFRRNRLPQLEAASS